MLMLIGFVQLNSKPPRKTYCPVVIGTLLLHARYPTYGHRRGGWGGGADGPQRPCELQKAGAEPKFIPATQGINQRLTDDVRRCISPPATEKL